MGNLALYRKYRSSDFDELLGQEHVSTTLNNALKKGDISHAYLFTGPHGIGKTSAARILASKVNGLKKGEASIDIIEIDAASNNGVDEIRELREKVHVAPNYHKYKVYIVDEVHMLSQAAFNALLKTLEEPPAHVIFILATTEPHKLPATIISRTQHFAFRPVEKTVIARHIKQVADRESIKIDDEAAASIADLSSGSMRDALSLLDQVSNSTTEISKKSVHDALGIADNAHIDELLEAASTGNRKQLLKSYDDLADSGIATGQLLDQLILSLRANVRTGDVLSTDILHDLCAIPVHSPYLDVMIEAVLLKHTHSGGRTTNPKSDDKPTASATPPPPKKRSSPRHKSVPQNQKVESKDKPKDDKRSDLSQSDWVKTLSKIKSTDNALYALLRSTEQVFENDKVIIKCKFRFHYRRLEESRNRQAIISALKDTIGRTVAVELAEHVSAQETEHIPEEADTAKMPAPSPAASRVDQVLSIFGGEIL